MRFRVRVVFCLLAVLLGVGCRKPLAPNIDRNQAPETWITAAPQDTISLRDPAGRPIPIDPNNHIIPIRFHLYWAGADADGAVAGFFYAVVETIPRPPEGLPFPELPGPKPSDYRFTTRTDTTFIFNVSEFGPDRQHAFFIYAVDNLGKADPTPARFTFVARDKFPPVPAIIEARATGRVLDVVAGSCELIPSVREYAITDTFNRATVPRDTVPVGSRLDFSWIGQVTLAGSYVTRYCYKLDENEFVCVDSSVRSVSYNTGLPGTAVITPGNKIFSVRAVDQAGGVNTTTRRFVMGFTPDTWWSGPDPALIGTPVGGLQWQDDPVDGSRYLEVPLWTAFPGIAGTLLSRDSVRVRPSCRPAMRTFFEIWGNRLYIRSEGDTVHLSSWAVFFNGGSDRDSRYDVRVDPDDPALPRPITDYPVLMDTLEVGSAIGFRSRVINVLDPHGTASEPSASGLYPIYEPASVFRAPRIAAYWPMFQSGKAYVLSRAEDGDGFRDSRITHPRQLADRVDQGAGTPYEQTLRPQVLTFYVNKPPRLRTEDPVFAPDPGDVFTTRSWDLNLLRTDVDPWNRSDPNRGFGGPTTGEGIFRNKVTLFGKTAAGEDTFYVHLPNPFNPDDPYFSQPSVMVEVPAYIAPGPVTIEIELCDCDQCEISEGQGRCVTYRIPVVFQPQTHELGSNLSPDAGRPGSRASSRSQ